MSKAERELRVVKARNRQKVALLDRNRVANPRGDRPRHANGRLKAPGPNEVVVEHRRHLLGNPAAKGHALRWAENALDLMYDRAWLPRALYENAGAFRRLYLAAFPPMPDLRTTRVDEEPSRERFNDQVATALRLPNPDGNPAAMTMLRSLWKVLETRPAARSALLEMCLLHGSWPSWLIAMVEGNALTPPEKNGRRALYEGLHIVGQVLGRPQLALVAQRITDGQEHHLPHRQPEAGRHALQGHERAQDQRAEHHHAPQRQGQ